MWEDWMEKSRDLASSLSQEVITATSGWGNGSEKRKFVFRAPENGLRLI